MFGVRALGMLTVASNSILVVSKSRGQSWDGGIESAYDLIWRIPVIVFILAEEFLKVLVRLIGRAILEQLGDLIHALQQVWRDEALEELEV